MKEITLVEEIKNEEIEISLSFDLNHGKIKINSDYSKLITKICEIIRISKEDLDSLNLYYNDADKDKINITNESDYEIFYSQVKDGIVKYLNLEIKEDSKLDKKYCSNSFCYYFEAKEESKRIFGEGDDTITDEKEEDNKNTIYIQEEKNENIILEESNNNNENNNNNKNKINFIDNYFKESDKNDSNDNTNVKETFKCTCKRCEEFPIINVLYYCSECDLILCAKCAKKMEDHEHELLKVESNDEYNEAVGESFEPIYKEKSYNIVLNNEDDENEIDNYNNQNQKSGFSLSNLVPSFVKNYWNKNKSQQ